MASIEQLLVKLVLAVFLMVYSEVINSEIVERRSGKW